MQLIAPQPDEVSAGREEVRLAGVTPASLHDAVAKDLEAVFAASGPRSHDKGWIALAEAVRSVRPQPKHPPRSLPHARSMPLAAGAVLAAVGLVGGIILASRPIERAVPQAMVALETHPAPEPAKPKPAPAIAVAPAPKAPPPRQEIVAAPLPAPVAQPAPPPPAPLASPPAAPPILALETPPPARHVRAPQATQPVRQTQVPETQLRQLDRDCERGGGCGMHVIGRADQLMAEAFDDAARAGASQADLADFQRRWRHLRDDTVDSPQVLIGNYALLAHDVARLTGGMRPPPRSRRAILEAER